MSEPAASVSAEGTARNPHYQDGLVDVRGEQRRRYFTYKADAGLMTGTTTSVMFTIDRSAREIWPYFKDFNLWQNSYHHYYSKVIGDVEGETVHLVIGSDPNDPNRLSGDYQVLRVIPEYLIVMSQLEVKDGPAKGMGGFLVFMLTEDGEKTVVTIMMQHDRLTRDLAEEEALEPWRKSAPDNFLKWGDYFIPTLKKIVCEGK
jgi:hypothetical protein